jgi:hypothetical protein
MCHPLLLYKSRGNPVTGRADLQGCEMLRDGGKLSALSASRALLSRNIYLLFLLGVACIPGPSASSWRRTCHSGESCEASLYSPHFVLEAVKSVPASSSFRVLCRMGGRLICQAAHTAAVLEDLVSCLILRLSDR